MTRNCLTLLALLTLLTVAGTSFGQIQNRQPGTSPSTRPTVSPYVLLSSRRTPVINYFGIVRPQREFRSTLRQLENRVTYDEAQARSLAEAGEAAAAGTQALPSTGHVTTFQNLSHYYPSGPASYPGISIRARRQ